jgi:hypothetical protein
MHRDVCFAGAAAANKLAAFVARRRPFCEGAGLLRAGSGHVLRGGGEPLSLVPFEQAHSK